MDLLIYEKLTETQLEKLKELMNHNVTKLISFDDFEKEDFTSYEKVICLATEVYSFLSTKVQEFLVANADGRVIELALLKAKVDDTNIIQEWINAVSVNDNKNIRFLTSINYENFVEGLTSFLNIIQRKLNGAEKVKIYTDGACSNNPGPGGWAAYVMYGSKSKKVSGFEADTTNNRMELTAVIKGLSVLTRPCKVELYADSAYVVNGMKYEWLTNWKANRWKNSDDKPVKNQDLWRELDKLVSYHEVEFFKVKGHADDEYNNLVDNMATSEIEKNLMNLKNEEFKDNGEVGEK